MNPRLLLLPLALLAFGCQKSAVKAEAAAPQPYKFPHGIHIESGVACVDCHAPILKASALKEGVIDVQIPTKSEVCAALPRPHPRLQAGAALRRRRSASTTPPTSPARRA